MEPFPEDIKGGLPLSNEQYLLLLEAAQQFDVGPNWGGAVVRVAPGASALVPDLIEEHLVRAGLGGVVVILPESADGRRRRPAFPKPGVTYGKATGGSRLNWYAGGKEVTSGEVLPLFCKNAATVTRRQGEQETVVWVSSAAVSAARPPLRLPAPCLIQACPPALLHAANNTI